VGVSGVAEPPAVREAIWKPRRLQGGTKKITKVARTGHVHGRVEGFRQPR
jgi:hypothetical protein